MITSQILQSKSLFILLQKIDLEMSESACKEKCPHCGGVLHRGWYQRKPRGGPAGLEASVSIRYSLCCGEEGCRKRLLPSSVLFSGRRVYFGVVFHVVVALRQNRVGGYTVEKLKQLFDVTRSTLSRWMQYFREIFPVTPVWKLLSGRLMPPVCVEKLPASLLERFIASGENSERQLILYMKALTIKV
jgi:hypothetical protein